MNTMTYSPYNSDPYTIIYQPEGYAFPQKITFRCLRHALWFIAELKAATGLTIKINI